MALKPGGSSQAMVIMPDYPMSYSQPPNDSNPSFAKALYLQMPDLAVEAQSPDDSKVELREKAVYYLKNGARQVWLVFSKTQQSEVHLEDAIKTPSIDDTIDDGDLLPGVASAHMSSSRNNRLLSQPSQSQPAWLAYSL